VLVVGAKLPQHLLRTNPFFIVVFQTLMLRDIADGAKRGSADFARPLGDIVSHGEDLRRVLVEEQVVIAEVAPAHMPVKILRLHVKREHVGQQLT